MSIIKIIFTSNDLISFGYILRHRIAKTYGGAIFMDCFIDAACCTLGGHTQWC